MSKLGLPPINPDGTTPPTATSGYEFNPAENEVIGGLAGSMRFVGAMSVAFGMLIALGGILSSGSGFNKILTIAQGVLLVVVGSYLLPAAGAFRAIVDSRGADIPFLMTALAKLRSVFRLQAFLWALACVLVVIAIFLMLGRTGQSSSVSGG